MVRIKIPAEDGSNEAGLGKLRDATREGNWWRAQSILKKHKIELTTKINKVEETMLHLAVGEGKNYFVQMLLDSIQNEELIEEKNIKGQTALHIAALVGNRYAAELLVKKINNLLYVKDNLGKEPLVTAYSNNQISTFAYLLEVTKKPGELLSKHRDSFDEFIVRLIYRKEYDLAFRFYKMCLKSQKSPTDKVLMAITRNFPSDCSFWEALIYPSWENVGQKVVKRSSSLFYSFKYIPNSCTLSTISVDSSLHFGASFTLLYAVYPPVEVCIDTNGFSFLALYTYLIVYNVSSVSKIECVLVNTDGKSHWEILIL
nr:ankyrin repeat-containing protein [Tanacetum cinerariifolium]